VENQIVSSTGKPSATVAIPTRDRSEYLDVTLASVVPQAARAGADVIVISDGDAPAVRAVAERHGARVVGLRPARGLNSARNTAFREAAHSDLIVLIDDDVQAPPGWLDALLDGVRASPDHGVFVGPIRARLEGGGPRACGREPAPITTLDLGPADRDADFVWGSNMAIRRATYERVGPFDETLSDRGDEEEWERRYRAADGRVRYIAGAWLEHRRTREDSTLRALARAEYRLGRSARRHDARLGSAPPLRSELRTLAGCIWHTFRRRCGIGIVMAAHSAGRLREAVARD
jgi:glycosyltransferase involved in cell wall biosynthesis